MGEQDTEDWEELIRSGLIPSNAAVPMHSIVFSNEFLGGPKYEKIILYVENGIGYYYERFKDHHSVGDYCLDIFSKDPKKLQEYIKFWKSEFEKLDSLFEEVRAKDLESLSDPELAALLETVYKQAVYWHGIAYNVDAIDTILVPKIQAIIEECFPKERKSKQAEIYNKITFPDVLSYVNRMSLEKLELFIALDKKPIEAKHRVPELVNKYYWVNFKWGESSGEYTERNFWEELQKAKPAEVAKELVETKVRFEKAWKEKRALLKELAEKNPLMETFAKIFEEYSVLHDLRKEGQMKSAHNIRLIYTELAKRHKTAKDLLYYYWPLELVQTIKEKKKIDVGLLARRKDKWLCEYHSNGKSEEWFSKEALKKRDEETGLGCDLIQKEIQGMSASQGRIIGKAKICLSANIADEKISEGDILITGMTMPDFVASMAKAGAIVTDEGGLTCHAAIIARELGKPCIVGTRLATRLIKDNDLLEVNANHGVVKIIKEAK